MTLHQGSPEAVALPRPYQDDHEHLADELHRLDLLIRLRLATMDMRNAMVPEDQTARTICISDEEVHWLLATGADDEIRATGNGDKALEDLRNALRRAGAEIETRSGLSAAEGTVLRLPALGRRFGLTQPELGAVVIALAPELRRKYDRLYAYLQDDITRRRPSVDLMLELLYPAERQRWAARGLFTRTAPLLRYDILRTVDDPQSPSGSTGLSQFMALDPRICQFLLGLDDMDARLVGCARLDRPARPGEAQEADQGLLCAKTLRLAERHLAEAEPEPCPLVLRLFGPDGAGKREVARSTSHQLGMPLLDVDLRGLTGRSQEETESLVRAALREAALQSAAVLLAGSDLLEQADAASLRLALSSAITDFGGLLFLTTESDPAGLTSFEGHPSLPVPVPLPDVAQSTARWRRILRGHTDAPQTWAEELGCRFHFSSGRMRAALEHAENRRRMEPGTRPLSLSDVSTACREQSRRRLSDLAVRVQPYARWGDLVLPEDRVARLKEICCQARHRHRVYDSWGFGARLSHGKGIGVLFSGPPGTGKTMAAEVLAHELDTDLYKVDLSGIVSKYVGETEKNLARIFSEAQTADAILFFDEADALYGKRTEVSDAHDRYANIETSYLLQRVEEHDGIVVLATNLRRNMDDAFTRRLRYIVEFPFPEADSRQRIWQALFPPAAPLAPDIDFAQLAKELPVAGGSIKNIVLNAACLASADGGAISRHHVLQAAKGEFEKIGKLWTGPGLPAGAAVDRQGGDRC
ncbi:AAA family ATPase [Streptomyces sp. NPDC056468]|uniref:AAA family ATPase n=1 Tax=Streptomyces sp. NPDC056468 TaxID=3345830 RepID=UPI00369A948B